MGANFVRSVAEGSESLWTRTIYPRVLEDLVSRVTRIPGQTREMLVVRSPTTDRAIADVPICSEDDVHLAQSRARKVQSVWRSFSVEQRKEIILRFHDIVLRRQETILDLLQIETGKARRDAFEEVLDVALVCQHYAFRAKSYLQPKWRKGALPVLTRTWELRHPVGVVGFISPWNYPLTLTISDAIPAILAGNAVILKPDSRTPLTALLGLRWLQEAGLPVDVFQIVTGSGASLGKTLIAGVDHICFTGSTATGRTIASQAGQSLIKCSLELGGKNPMLVMDDADLNKAVNGAIRGCFANSGQLCISFERLLVQKNIYNVFLHEFVKKTKHLRIGPEKNLDVEMGSLISKEQLEKVEDHVRDAESKGARILAGGRARPDLGPFFYEPTILVDVTKDMKVFQQETFGPVVAVTRVADGEEAICMANDSAFGLNASIWTGNVTQGRKMAARIRCGTVNINESYAATWGSVDAPMGGMKASGVGRRHGIEGFAKFTEAQTVAVQSFIPVGPWPFTSGALYARVMTAALRLLKHIPGLR